MRSRADTAARLDHARSEARRALAALGMAAAADIDIDALARAHRAEVAYQWIDGANARVMRLADCARICVSTAIQEPAARRWTLGHEIGHLALDHVIERGAGGVLERACSPLGPSRSVREREASVYATELLMPTALVLPLIQGAPVTLNTARRIAETFRTSLYTSAIRLVELSGERCAVAYCSLGEVEKLTASATFPAWIPKRRQLDARAVASGYFADGAVDECARLVPADAWLSPGHVPAGTEIMEQAVILPTCGAVIAMLWLPDARDGRA